MSKNCYKSIRVSYAKGKHELGLLENNFREVKENEVLVRVKYSSLNYKDALSITGKTRIIRKETLIPGLDLSGTVIQSNSKKFKKGEKVLASGAGLGEFIDGGFTEYSYVPEDVLVRIPESLNLIDTMRLGTAGFTAAIAIEKMILNKQDKISGPILVTGATGGVGSISLSILSKLGYETIALTRKKSSKKYLKSIGASHILQFEKINNNKILNTKLFSGAIDNIGGEVLDWIIKSTKDNGNIVSVGMAFDSKLETTVFPFIMRGVNILGISSTNYIGNRQRIWESLSKRYKPKNLNIINKKSIGLSDISKQSKNLLLGKNTGRIIIKMY